MDPTLGKKNTHRDLTSWGDIERDGSGPANLFESSDVIVKPIVTRSAHILSIIINLHTWEIERFKYVVIIESGVGKCGLWPACHHT